MCESGSMALTKRQFRFYTDTCDSWDLPGDGVVRKHYRQFDQNMCDDRVAEMLKRCQ